MIYAHRWSIALTLVVAGFLAFSITP